MRGKMNRRRGGGECEILNVECTNVECSGGGDDVSEVAGLSAFRRCLESNLGGGGDEVCDWLNFGHHVWKVDPLQCTFPSVLACDVHIPAKVLFLIPAALHLGLFLGCHTSD